MSYKKIIVRFLIFYLTFAAVAYFLRIKFGVGPELLVNFINSFGQIASLVYSLLLYLGLSIPLNPLSELILINIAAFSFNLPTAIFATFCAHTLSICINYYFGKKFGWKIVKKVAGKNVIKKTENLVGKISYKNLFVLRWILPINAIFGIDILSYLSGLTKLKFMRYYLASIIPWTSLNILFFTTTKYFIGENQYLFFIPAVIIIILPGIVLYKVWKV